VAKQQANLILPRVMGCFPASDKASRILVETMQEHTKHVCSNTPLDFIIHDIQYKLHCMDICLVGVPDETQANAKQVKAWLEAKQE